MFRHELPGGRHLRLLEESDAEALVHAIEANREYLAEWLPWVDATRNDVETRLEFIRRSRRQVDENDGFQAAIAEVDELVGVVGFHGVDWKNRSTSIGYWLAADRQGRGIMTEAVRALTLHAFDVWSLNRVEIRVATGNRRSAAIPRRLGFTEEGVLRQAERHGDAFRDVAQYALVTNDPAAARLAD